MINLDLRYNRCALVRMYTSMYMSIYICADVTYVYVHMYTNTHACTRVYMYTCGHVHPCKLTGASL